MKPTCTINWTGIAWRRAVAGKLSGPGRETLDQAIHDAHEAGLIIVDVFSDLGWSEGRARRATERTGGSMSDSAPSHQAVPTLDLELLAKLHESATPAPWRECGHDRGGCVCGQVWSESTDQFLFKPDAGDEAPVPTQETKLANAALVAAMRNNLEALLALARSASEMKARFGKLESALEFLDHNGCSLASVDRRGVRNGGLQAQHLIGYATELGWNEKAGE